MTDQAEKANPFSGFVVTKGHKPEPTHLTISPISQLEGVSIINGEWISFINLKGAHAGIPVSSCRIRLTDPVVEPISEVSSLRPVGPPGWKGSPWRL